jgi:hypothetical protein
MDYQIKPPGKLCAATGKPLAPGTECRSVLVEQNGQLVRLDYSPEGWSDPPEGAIGIWKTRLPEQVGPPKLDPEQLMRYFEQLQEEASPGHGETCYLLALILLKQRRLRLDNIRSDDGGSILELSGLRGEGSFEVPNFEFADDDLLQRQNLLRNQLAAEWNG